MTVTFRRHEYDKVLSLFSQITERAHEYLNQVEFSYVQVLDCGKSKEDSNSVASVLVSVPC